MSSSNPHLGQISTRLLTTGVTLIAGTLLAGSPIFNALAGAAGGMFANDLGDLAKRIGQRDNLLQNDDLAKAVGLAIASVIRKVAEEDFPSEHRSLEKLAKTVTELWPALAKATDLQTRGFDQLWEANLPLFFSTNALEFASLTALTSEDWEYFLNHWLQMLADTTVPSYIVKHLGNKLHTMFPKALREELKHDFEHGGRAFAGMALLMFGEIRSALTDISQNNSIQYYDITQRLDYICNLQQESSETADFFKDLANRITDILGEVQKGVVELNEKVDIQLDLLKEIREYYIVNGYFSQSPQMERPRFTDINQANDLYIERPPLEDLCYQEIKRRGMIIRIRSPHNMGRSMLLEKIFKYAEEQDYLTALLNFRDTYEVISNYSTLLQWVCNSVNRELGLENIDARNYWESKSSNLDNNNIDEYFHYNILNKINKKALVLALYNIDLVFPFDFASKFITLLRSWHESAKIRDNWGKLRFILLYSTECYVELSVEQSIFKGVGRGFTLDDFTNQQIFDLASQYGVQLDDNQIHKIMAEVGGHPYLINGIIAYLQASNNQNNSFDKMINSLEELFEEHLDDIWNKLSQKSKISELMIEKIRLLLTGDQSINSGEEKIVFLLDSLGLVKEQDNRVDFCNNLYRKYLNQKISR